MRVRLWFLAVLPLQLGLAHATQSSPPCVPYSGVRSGQTGSHGLVRGAGHGATVLGAPAVTVMGPGLSTHHVRAFTVLAGQAGTSRDGGRVLIQPQVAGAGSHPLKDLAGMDLDWRTQIRTGLCSYLFIYTYRGTQGVCGHGDFQDTVWVWPI